ncbi:MAG: SigB/SigF/SigG family RNA polymerase sigma factor [Clostridia bacterium]|nr:SigB/SigF/SigG family RNA polymerase sigma factor [Clostridia bacterium]
MSGAHVLEHEETLDLIAKSNAGDEEATEKLVRHNIALVKSIASKYRERGMDYDDLFQTGCLGLIKAVRNYNADFGVRFSTYAVPMIAGEIKRTLRDDNMIHISRSMKELGTRAMAVQEKLQNSLGRDVRLDEIAAELGCDVLDVAQSLEAMRPHISIYEPVYDDSDGTSVADRIPANEDTQEQIINDLFLKEMLSSLSLRDRSVIDMRYFRGLTQSQTARLLGISQVQVSRLETRIIKELRERYVKQSGIAE